MSLSAKSFRLFILLSCLNCITLFAQAKFEPPTGSYFGAFVMNETSIGGSISKFDSITGKRHSSYFSYAAWGQPFPQWAFDYAAGNRTVQIGFEPNNGLGEVVDGDYIRTWARTAQKINAPVFLRFASEMNGNWVPWYGTPELYKEKFRLVYTIMKEEAPNVVMVWCPNDVPNDTLSGNNNPYVYYPGDDYTDWVGIDFYGVYFYENGTPERKDPREKLKVVYNKYAGKKPIMICEWAAAHYTTRVTPAQDCTPYALAQMDSLYNGSAQFPALKSINWFSWNTLSINKSNFSLLENNSVLTRYKNLISNPRYLSQPFINVPLITLSAPFAADTVAASLLHIEGSVRCDVPIDSIVISIAGKNYRQNGSSQILADINVSQIPAGIYQLKVSAYTVNGRFSNFATKRIIVNTSGNYSRIIVDDSVGNSFTTSGSWSISNSQPDRYGAYYHVTPAGNGTAKATWKVNIPVSGYYIVSAFWSQHSNRSGAVPYLISSGGRTDTIIVSQQERGGKWNELRTVYLQQGLAEISVISSSGGYTVADAVQCEWAFVTDINSALAKPESKRVFSIYPLPFTSSFTISVNSAEQFPAEIILYTTQGKEVFADRITFRGGKATLAQNRMNSLPSGMYILKILNGSNTPPVYIKVMKVK